MQHDIARQRGTGGLHYPAAFRYRSSALQKIQAYWIRRIKEIAIERIGQGSEPPDRRGLKECRDKGKDGPVFSSSDSDEQRNRAQPVAPSTDSLDPLRSGWCPTVRHPGEGRRHRRAGRRQLPSARLAQVRMRTPWRRGHRPYDRLRAPMRSPLHRRRRQALRARHGTLGRSRKACYNGVTRPRRKAVGASLPPGRGALGDPSRCNPQRRQGCRKDLPPCRALGPGGIGLGQRLEQPRAPSHETSDTANIREKRSDCPLERLQRILA